MPVSGFLNPHEALLHRKPGLGEDPFLKNGSNQSFSSLAALLNKGKFMGTYTPLECEILISLTKGGLKGMGQEREEPRRCRKQTHLGKCAFQTNLLTWPLCTRATEGPFSEADSWGVSQLFHFSLLNSPTL